MADVVASAARPVVIDTDVASFIINDDPIRVPRYEPHLQGFGVVVPFAVLAELLLGAENRGLGQKRRADIADFIARSRVHYPDHSVCERWAEIRSAGKRRGRPLPQQDAWIAAVALHLNAPLVSHNARHYSAVPGLRVFTEPDV